MKPLLLSVLVVLLLSSCLPAAPIPTDQPGQAGSPEVFSPTQPPSRTPEPTETRTPAPSPTPEIRRVLLISIDGLRPEVIAMAPMPNLQALMASGAYSLGAQTIHPSATLPAHASMLLGTCPDKHGVDWNDYDPQQGYANGTSIFQLAHEAGLSTVMIVGKEKIRQLTLPDTLDTYLYINDRDVVIAAQAVPILQQGFHLAFIHFPTVDWMGHEYGWLSWEQFSVARRADEALGTLLQALEASGQRSQTLIIVTSDHGGRGEAHGSSHPEDMTIPWVANGPGITPKQIAAPVNTTDTAATIASFLNLPVPADWDGLPVTEIIGGPAGIRPDPRCP